MKGDSPMLQIKRIRPKTEEDPKPDPQLATAYIGLATAVVVLLAAVIELVKLSPLF